MRQFNPPHPGKIIREIYLEPFKEKYSRSEIARRLNVSKSTFTRLVNEDSDITSEMAVRLSNVLGGSAESWINLQTSYNLSKATKKLKNSNFEKIEEFA